MCRAWLQQSRDERYAGEGRAAFKDEIPPRQGLFHFGTVLFTHRLRSLLACYLDNFSVRFQLAFLLFRFAPMIEKYYPLLMNEVKPMNEFMTLTWIHGREYHFFAGGGVILTLIGK